MWIVVAYDSHFPVGGHVNNHVACRGLPLTLKYHVFLKSPKAHFINFILTKHSKIFQGSIHLFVLSAQARCVNRISIIKYLYHYQLCLIVSDGIRRYHIMWIILIENRLQSI